MYYTCAQGKLIEPGNINFIFRCQDYIRIETKFSGTEICGNIESLSGSDLQQFFSSENLTVYFRTSEEVVDSGFMMAVLCLDQTDLDGTMANPLALILYLFRTE